MAEAGTAERTREMQCVVTAQAKSGKSIIVSHAPVNGVTVGMMPGYVFYRLWGSDAMVDLPSDGTPPAQHQFFPPKNGFRFGMFSLPPAASAGARQSGSQRSDPQQTNSQQTHSEQTGSQQAPTPAQLEEMEQKLPGALEVLEADHPGMHTTDTVDFDIVISGEVVLELDDGAEVVLKAGDCVIQNGTRHAWHNRSSERCVIAFSLVGAQRKRAA